MSGAWCWVGLLWSDRVKLVLDNYGDRLSDVSIFAWQVDANGALTQTFDPSQLDPYRAKWPHIRWWGCFRNNGVASIFTALRNNAGARATLCNQLADVLAAYDWLDGIDIDLEQGGAVANAAAAEALFSQIAAVPHSVGKLCSAALPALTADGSVGGENWVRYRQLGDILDHLSIMSYDMAWGGSAPGAVSPGWWMRPVYQWAVSQTDPAKISMGLPAYCRGWHIHMSPDDPNVNYHESGGYRGTSASYYGVVLWMNGSWTPLNTNDLIQPHVGWLGWRDMDGHWPTALLGVWDWRQPDDRATSSGWTWDTYNGKPYGVRYGRGSGNPIWSLVDDTAPTAQATYVLSPRYMRDIAGQWVAPRHGLTLTVELLRRPPSSAAIMDDDCRTSDQLASDYYRRQGNWTQYPEESFGRVPYGQYRISGGGSLEFAHDFGTQALHVQARAQLPSSGTFGVHIGNVEANISQSGLVTLSQGSTIASASISAPGTSTTPINSRAVIGLRIRGTHARVYASLSETNIPQVLEANVGSVGGNAGVQASASAWFDHVRLGDGWWYQPHEAVTVQVGSWSWVAGRLARSGVTWDGMNRFRPNADVDEPTTRKSIGLDWDFDHLKNIPIAIGQDAQVIVRPLDTEVWLGRLLLCDADGAKEIWWSDVHALTYWASQAEHTYHLAGVAMWTLGQEDVRVWESLSGGLLPPETQTIPET